ncbi:DUF2058 domain-containing protein [Kineobactrum sediminis]|uniref:DUF2058 domain-containing protein n=1 Tax=Kineobactrum sediminis TaxID=1905677 RepID=A0A2N5Y5T4_9GAMM|nr:DUF2058 domain-containing protein [Kineobactrum sediminis]PLW83758.1 DUF2058 domain-containing protein [Kineobactrum sediminis]
MAGSLKDQLLKAGLADADKAKKLDKEKRKVAKIARRSGVELVDETREAARAALAEKARRDRELNQANNSKALRKAINAQIKQLIETHKLPKSRGDIGFNFTDGKKVKKLYVTSIEQKQLSAGQLVIVRQGDQYEILPHPVAAKIAERDSDRVIVCRDEDAAALSEEEQDWYKDYEIPDDLMW